jgi:hypothetical protein
MPAFGAVGHSTDPVADDYLWEQAFAPDEGIHFVGRQIEAIRGISRRDPDAAFKAAESMLYESETRDREMLPDLLLEIDPGRGSDLLCRQYPAEESIIVKRAIARSLRMSGDLAFVSKTVDRWLAANAFHERKAGLEICGTMEDGWKEQALRSACENEADRELREESISSLRAQWREREAKKLLSRIDSVQLPIAKWCFAEAILNVADSQLLLDRRDPLGFWKAYRTWPASLRWHTKRIADKKLKDAEKRAEDEDRKRHAE